MECLVISILRGLDGIMTSASIFQHGRQAYQGFAVCLRCHGLESLLMDSSTVAQLNR